MTKRRYFFLVLILGSLTALSPFSIDMYLPAFAQIATTMHTTVEQVGLSLSSYFIGLAAGQLLYGPLLDKYGRKKPLYVGLSVYILASFGCLSSQSIDMLIGLRFIQAVGGCAAGVASVAMIRDIFPVNENAKVFALLMLVLGASPMLAPTIGGFVTDAFSWRIIFFILAGIAAAIFAAVIFTLPDKYVPNKKLSLKPLPIILGFWDVLKVPQFYTYAIAGSVSFAGLFTYVSGAPVVFMKIYHLDAKAFGLIFAGLSIGFIGCSQLNTLLLRKFRSEQIVPVAFAAQFITGVLFLIGAVASIIGLPGIIVMVFLQLCCVGLISPNTSALSIAPFAKNAGTASSLLGAIQLGLGSLATVGISSFHVVNIVPLASVMCGAGFLACAIYFIAGRNIKMGPQSSKGEAAIMH
ncbi:multidrug effflux MFS transporter [Mucilaginibacter boryungensis]|uniref:Multidrug effflux MFS transporter n=1 Tax=Mucilaginibacter boryungensis TaxID=768480 RepID=A0ABR9XG91_9SPHI|nr:multidrug effflux MFS transporter [Mucilaginibacter boryungensis]MBE9666215.1 multidrug effflux MFS transporter [Mucilaginibacter boryungensis]